jgi:cell division protein FtsQ
MDRLLALPGLSSRPRRTAGAGVRRPGRRRSSRGDVALAGAAAVLSSLFARRWLRLAVVAAAVLAIALRGGWMLLRHSGITAVRNVRIVGVSGPESAAIDSALTEAARRMSTLGVSDAALQAAVQRFRIVRAVRAQASFPHGLRIVVREQQPVAVLTSGSERTAVAADGVVLGPAFASGSLPSIAAPAADILAAGVRQPPILAALALLGAAPAPLAARVASVAEGSQGLTATMRNGLTVYFGNASLPHAKWLALARVLADPSSHGASYIDVRSPARPAAGGFAPGTGPAASGSAASAAGGEQHQTTTAQPTVSSIAESLATAVGGPAAAGAPSTTAQEQSEQHSAGTGEAGSSHAAESASGGTGAGGAAGAAAQGGGSQGGEASANAATGGSEPSAPEGG